MSASDADQVQDPVLVDTDPVISHEVPVPVDGQILKDVSNLGSNETPESVAVGLVSLNKADASNGAVGTTSADEMENAPSNEQSASVEDGVFVDDKEVIIHGSNIALEKTKDVQDAPVVGADTAAASDSITTDNVDNTTLDEKGSEIIDIPNTSEVESVATVEHGIPADSDLTAPMAKITEANTIDDSVNDSTIEIPTPVLEKNQGCAKDNEDNAAPTDGVKLAEIGNHNKAVEMNERDATDNVDDNPEIMDQAPNGETLAIAEVALQEKGKVVKVDDIASSAAEGDAAASEAVTEAQGDVPNVTVEDIVQQTQGEEDAPTVAEEQVPVIEAAAPTEDLEDGAGVATETEIAVESNDAGVAIEEVEQGGVDETSVEPTNNLDAGPLVEEIPDTGEDAVVAADETTEAPETVEEPTNDTEASVLAPVEAESISSEATIAPEVEVTREEGRPAPEVEPVVATETIATPVDEVPNIPEEESVDAGAEVEAEASLEEVSAPVEGESVPASEEITAPVDASVTVHEAASVPVEEDVVPASTVITEPVIESAEFVPTAEDVVTVTPETTNEEASAKVEVEPVTADEEVIAAPVDKPVTTEAVAEVGNEEASVPVETEPIATPVDEPIAPVAEFEVPREGATACVEADPLNAGEVITAPGIESEEVAQTSDEIGAAAPETSVETYEEAPITIEVQHVENIAEEENEETTVSVLAEPVAETEGVTEEASETAGHDDVTQEVPGSVAPDSIPTSAATVVEVAKEPVPAPIKLSEETFATTVNIENEIPASVDALDETTVVEAESALIEAPVEVTVAASLAAEHDVTGEAVPIVVAEDDPEPAVPSEELTTAISEAAAPQADDEATHAEASATVETELITASGDIATPTTQVADEAAPSSIHAPDADNDKLVEAQATHTAGEIALDTEPSTDIAEGEAVAEKTPAPAVEAAGVEDAPETIQEAPATIVEAENAGVESVPQADEGASVEETPSAKPLEPEEETKIEETTVIEIQQPQSLAENAQSSADVSELAGKEAIDIGSAGQGDDVAVEESTSAPVVASVAVKENVPELRTGVISIETSLDTTPFTPVLDSGIGFKEQEPALFTLSSIAEEFERPKSTWEPSSFQVSTFGSVESSGVGDAGLVPELAETGELASVPLLVVEDAPVNEQVPTIDASEDFISVDQPSLEQPPRPWTTSYSVHSQGSPTKVELAEDLSSIDEPVPTHELPVEEQGGHSQGSPAAVPKEVEEAPPLDAESIEQSIPESTAAFPIDAQETTHSESLTAEFDKGETPSSVEQSQNNNIGEVVAAAIAPAIAIAALGARIQGLVPVADEEAPQADATLTVDTTAVPLLSVPSEVVDADATDIIVDAQERPRSPWTPSYSVTKQGADLSQEEEAEVDHLEPLPPAAAQAATTSDSEPLLNEVQEDDPASNALQTRPSYTVAGTEEIAKNEQFLLFGLRAIVAYLWVLPKWLSMTPSDHSRQGSSSSSSSSSSKFFPGGWFTPKPNEGSTSLDVAQGEFASSSSKVTTSNDVFETLGSEVTGSSAAVNVAAEDDGRKRKWCVVM